MSNELREAAERAFGGPTGYRWCDVNDALKVHPDVMRDFERVARAYLSEHPADDGGPVTEEWLLSVGFDVAGDGHLKRVKWGDNGEFAIGIHLGNPTVAILLYSTQGTVIESMDGLSQVPRAMNARGDVRRLCAALGIELKERIP